MSPSSTSTYHGMWNILYDSFGAFQVRVPKNEKKYRNNMHINCLLHVNVV